MRPSSESRDCPPDSAWTRSAGLLRFGNAVYHPPAQRTSTPGWLAHAKARAHDAARSHPASWTGPFADTAAALSWAQPSRHAPVGWAATVSGRNESGAAAWCLGTGGSVLQDRMRRGFDAS
jgi:hypothetical protein